MNYRLLIDAVVAQSVELISELIIYSDTHVDVSELPERFLTELAERLHQKGVRKKMIADMFDIKLRTLQRRLKRQSEQLDTERRNPLFNQVYAYLRINQPCTRLDLFTRFYYHDEDTIRSILAYMRKHHIIVVDNEKSGSDLSFRLSDTYQQLDTDELSEEACKNMVWYLVNRLGTATRAQISHELNMDEVVLESAITHLLSEEKLKQHADGSFTAESIELEFMEHGKQISMLGHYEAVVSVLKRAAANDATHASGTTYAFDYDEDHPFSQAIDSLFGELDERIDKLWDYHEAYNNQQHPESTKPQKRKIIYVGNVLDYHHSKDLYDD